MAEPSKVSSRHRYASLAGRNVIVTGGGRGLGQVMARALVEQGANVMISGARATAEVDRTATELNDLGAGRCVGMAADVSDPAACERVLHAAEEAFGSVDVLVNNAGRGPTEQMGGAGLKAHVEQGLPTSPQLKHSSRGDRFWEGDVDGHLRMLMTNLAGPFLMARVCVPGMIERGFGRIVNISTSRPTMVHTGFGPYGPLKAALEASSRIWAAELEGARASPSTSSCPEGPATPRPSLGASPGPAHRRSDPGEGPRGEEGSTKGLLPPAIMGPPILWLASDESGAVTGRRFSARDWSDEIAPADAARHAESDRIEIPHVV